LERRRNPKVPTRGCANEKRTKKTESENKNDTSFNQNGKSQLLKETDVSMETSVYGGAENGKKNLKIHQKNKFTKKKTARRVTSVNNALTENLTFFPRVTKKKVLS